MILDNLYNYITLEGRQKFRKGGIYEKTARQKAIDNRANQLNPNNPAYYKSRMDNAYSKTKNKKQSKRIVANHNHFGKHHCYNQTSKKTHLLPDFALGFYLVAGFGLIVLALWLLIN